MARSDTDIPFTTRLGATQVDVRAALVEIRHWLLLHDAPACLCGTVELVMAEALNNIAEHAFAASGTGQIWVSMRTLPTHVAIRISDNGQAMPSLAPPARRLPAIPETVADLPEGGWGWFLIHSLTRDLCYLRQADKNLLCFEVVNNHGLVA